MDLPSAALDTSRYYQFVPHNPHRSMFTFCCSVKNIPTTNPRLLFGHHMGTTLACTIRQKNASTNVPVNSDIFIKPYCTHDELDECVALQQLVWRQSNLQLMPRRSFIIAIKTGGIVLGAYICQNNSPVLVGLVVSFVGILPGKNTEVYWHTEMLGIHPDVRNQHIGRRLLLELRKFALARNIKLIKYNFDPTETRNAHIYIRRLGGIGRQYSANHYGMFLSQGNPNPFAGRLHMECWLDSPHTHQCLNPEKSNDYIIPRTEIVDEVVVPAMMGEWKRTGDICAIIAYKEINEKLLAAFARGLVVLGFRIEPDGTSVYEFGIFNANESSC